ncbi:MAG: hypothetical protein WBO97_10300 [Tepidiformaceae bacterium]
MFIHPAAMQYIVPGDPTTEALYREEFLTAKDETSETATESTVDHTAHKRVTMLRAHLAAGVGRFFV